ncbi:SUMO-activating enzyme subunit 1-like, partial [Stegodyphus dumicola]|uniref:SUMO-activating enzyme subunit 1-like n=1 Tax=Stegodyphus dumicola TaxID=202533 RepID=UPI0015AF2550
MMGVKRNLDAAGLSANASSITEDEAQLYDRQIRLWGMDCQKRLRAAKVLVIGLNGLGAEVVKNLTLSGVKSITIVDDAKIKPSDFCAQFFIAGSESGKNRAEASKAAIQELNPNVEIIIDTEPISSKPTEFFAGFQAVFATNSPLNILIKVNKACRENSVLFYCGDTWGFYGYGFLDLLNFTYTSVIKFNETNKEVHRIEKLEFCPLGTALGAKVGAGLNRKVNNVFFLLH